MKKIYFLLLMAMAVNFSVKAAPGDTTWVQANNTQFTHYGSFDSAVTFPSATTTYRRIYMIFTLGKYACPPGTTDCGSWDYTVQNYLMTPAGDTLEIGRLISPYASTSGPRTPLTWTQRYVYDVTDYVALLKGAATMRVFYSGYTWGFTGDIKFAFIEGTPDRNVMGVHKLWSGSYAYGDAANDINAKFAAHAETAPAGTETATVKFTVTGHGSDDNGCCEFMSHNYQVMLNSASVATKTIWRDNCGSNELYPQTGTWLYERGNWCPGAMVYSNYHDLPGITGGNAFTTAIQFDPYTGSGSLGSYTTEAHMIYYGPINKTTDAMIADIVAPTDNENHYRENPTGDVPVIHVKNTGSTTITSMQFWCSVDGGSSEYYNWTGSLAALEETDVTFSEIWAVRVAAGTSGSHTFNVNITQVNGNSGDDDLTNNTMTSTFIGAPVWPVSFKIVMKTNNQGTAGISETQWQIYDMLGNVVASRTGAAINTLYTDTVTLGPAIYKFVITDGSCDGLQWWAHASDGSGINTGYLNVKKLAGTNILMKGYNYSGTFGNDFGCGYSQYFATDWPTSINNVTANSLELNTYPNPAQNTINIDISGYQQVRGTMQVLDALGRIVMTARCTAPHQEINTAALINGVYTVIFINDGNGNKLQSRVVIAK